MSGKESGYDSGYDMWKKEMKIEKLYRLSTEDVRKMRGFWKRYRNICEKHEEWWYKLGEKCNPFSENIKDYSDSQIKDVCGEEIYREGQRIKEDWEHLREDMERYIESKNLPL